MRKASSQKKRLTGQPNSFFGRVFAVSATKLDLCVDFIDKKVFFEKRSNMGLLFVRVLKNCSLSEASRFSFRKVALYT